MPENDREKLNRVEEMKNRLFSRSYETRIKNQNVFSPPPERNVPDSWQNTQNPAGGVEKFFMRTSVFKKFFIFSIVFFVLAVAYASYMFFAGGNTVSNDNIDISVQGNTFTAGGEDLPLIIEITNRNNSPLDLVDLVVEYPKSSSGSASDDTERMRESLGTIPAGGVRSENLKVVLFGEQGSTRTIKISIEYRVDGSNAIFVKEKTYDVAINSSPINLTIDAPQDVGGNQDMTLNIKAELNANKVVPQVMLKVDYPLGFEFGSAKPAPTLGDNVWSLDDLAPGAERNIAITGKMVDVSDGEEKTFRAWSGTEAKNDKSAIGVVFNSAFSTVVIKRPSVEAKLFVNGVYQREYASGPNDVINGSIHWVNNMDTKVNDLSVQAKIAGNILDRRSIKAGQGFYNSLQNTITWDKSSEYDFAEINPGESGTLEFSFAPSSFSALNGASSEPSINIQVSISGKQAGDGFTSSDLSNVETKVIKITSSAGFAAKALYYSGAFKNTGPIPPTVEKETTYTVAWSLSNTSNNISKGQVRATLPSWIHFVGPISPKSEDLTYNDSTNEIIWNVGNIPKGAGITGAGREVSFQLAFTPSLSQVGTTPDIINDAVLTGHDDFANVDIRVNKAALNTRLTNDPTFPLSGDRVTE